MWTRILLAFVFVMAVEEIPALYGGEGAGPTDANRPIPEIEAITPNWGASGQIFTVAIQGKHLETVREVGFAPPIGIEVYNPPVVNETGTLATVKISIMVHAPLGPRLVTLVTPSGSFPEKPTGTNIFRVAFAHIH